jgi:trehalose 6-phosphate synthase
VNQDTPLVLVSNRGPATFEGGEAKRGGGGLVTALKGLVHHRDAVWVASAMTDEDAKAAEEHDGRSFEVEVDDDTYRIKLVTSDPDAYDSFYNVVANPLL